MLFGSGSEGRGNLMEKTATENGTYTAAEEIDPETGEIFDPPKDGYSVFTVDLALDDKSVSITTSQITGSQTAEFEYDPHDENPELEGYSLFTIDLSAVKDDIEELQQTIDDINQLLEEDDPDYDPTTDDPVQQVNDIIEEKDQKEQEAEECEECRAEVIAKMQEYDPDFNPQTCQDMVDEVDKIAGYKFPEDTPYEDVMKIVGMDTVEIEGNDYYFDVRAVGWYKSFNPNVYPQIDIEKSAFYIATTPTNYDYGSLGWSIRVYNTSTGEYVTSIQLGTAQGFDAGEYVKLISLNINYTNKTMNGVYETDDPYPHTPIQISMSANLTNYITTTSPNPRYKVKNN